MPPGKKERQSLGIDKKTTGKNTGRIQPHSLEAEMSVLGALLLDIEAIYRVMEFIGPDDFYSPAHKKIFQAIIDLNEKSLPCDLVTLTSRLKDLNLLKDIGGASYLASLSDYIPTAANIEYWAKIVRDKSVLRQLIHKGTMIVSSGYEEAADVTETLDSAEQTIFEISETRKRRSFIHIKDVIKENIKRLEELYDKKESITGIPTGFIDLDRLTAGFQPSNLIIIAGRPAMGKTAIALNMAHYASVNAGTPVAFFTLEMSREELGMRFLCSEARLDASRMRTGRIRDDEWPQILEASDKIADMPVYIDDTWRIPIIELRSKVRRLKKEVNIGLVIVDYLQLVRGTGREESRLQEISEISMSLKALAKEMEIPVIALSQLNRMIETRDDKRPRLSDLRESGSIEQDADVVIFIYRDEVYNQNEDNPKKGIAEVIIGKQRNGPQGTIELYFEGKWAKFENKLHDVTF